MHVHANHYNFNTISLRCGHCKRLAPEYESAATELSLNDPPVPLAKVDATVETSLANRFGINGYPTLKVFHEGTPYDYEGPRTAQGKHLNYYAENIDACNRFTEFYTVHYS